jgi:hypothetical protein
MFKVRTVDALRADKITTKSELWNLLSFIGKLDIFVVLIALAIIDAAALREFSLSTF